MITLQTLARALGGEISGNQLRCPGPDHSAADRSLNIKLDSNAPDGFVVHSFAGDDPIVCKDYVRSKAGLPAFKPNGNNKHHRASDDAIAAALMAAVQRNNAGPKGRVVAVFDYTEANGTLLYQVLKYDPKGFRQRRPDGNSGWIWKLDNVSRVPYRWPDLAKYPDATIFVCEGEKDADRVASLGHCTTCAASGKWIDDCITALADRDIIILQDNDEAGAKKALEAAAALHGTAKTIRIVLLPDLPDRGDVSDWLDADDRRAKELERICLDAPLWEPTETNKGDGEASEEEDNWRADTEQKTKERLLQSSAEFSENFEAPDPLIENIIMRKFIYALTGHVSRGKTAAALLFTAHIGLGKKLGNLEVEKGRVLYLAGENYVDVQMRWIAMAQQMDFDIKTIGVYFRRGRFKLSKRFNQLCAEVDELGGVDLVIVDGSTAFFEGDDENNNAQAATHAVRLRELTTLKGNPGVLVLCHPPKNAGDDNLQPRGAGAMIAEWDGNLTATKDGTVTTIHWQTKIRGPDFAPVPLLLRTVTHERLVSSGGKLLPTVVAEPLSDMRQEELHKAARYEEDQVLEAINNHPHSAQADIARHLGWLSPKGEIQKTKIHRIIKELKKQRLVDESRSGLLLTEKGKKAVKADAASKQ